MIFGYALLAAMAIPSLAFAHHPGALGPINHLGFTQIALTAIAALVDGINPTAFGVLLLLIRPGALSKNRSFAGVLYIAGILTSYLVAGVGLWRLFENVGLTVATIGLQLILAFFLFIAGLKEIAPKLVTLPEKMAISLNHSIGLITTALTRGFAYPLGVVIGFVELLGTGAIYTSFLQAISFDPTAPKTVVAAFMVIYLVVFLLPIVSLYLFSREVNNLWYGAASQLVHRVVGLAFIGVALWIGINAYVTIEGLKQGGFL
ncbi:MAG: hypothetical protein WAP74_03050 [Patescibacteria group bacterium]